MTFAKFNMKQIIILPLLFLATAAFGQDKTLKEEKHLKNITQLTNGGDNAEAYFSPNGKKLVFQSNNKDWTAGCDQIFCMKVKDAAKDKNKMHQRISNGLGRTTCSFFMPNGKDMLYASTFKGGKDCPKEVKMKGKYLWSIFPSYDIYVANKKGQIIKQLTDAPGYDAEAVVSPQGDKIVFTSTRSGDLELWTMDIDGSNQKQITFGLGYDGGAFFSPDGKKLVFRSSRPKTPEAIKEYKDFLAQGLVAPTNMEIYTCNVDGSDLQQITDLGKANWAPYFHPSGEKIIFSSNHKSQRGYDFQLYMIDIKTKELEQITFNSIFNAFPMFSPDGKKLVFSSNRDNGGTRDTNVFIADWED